MTHDAGDTSRSGQRTPDKKSDQDQLVARVGVGDSVWFRHSNYSGLKP